MSLNFVSTTVLSSTDGISHNTETRLETSDTASISRGENYKPLYEQLRKNAKEEEDKYDEVTKAMRGTRALDEEDVAHLKSVDDERAERLRKQAMTEKEEVENFRLAKIDYDAKKRQSQEPVNNDGNEVSKNISVFDNATNTKRGVEELEESNMTKRKPQIVVKKKRRRKIIEAHSNEKQEVQKNGKIDSTGHIKNDAPSKKPENKVEGGLSELLCGYDSDSD
jgi:hypothetical protein